MYTSNQVNIVKKWRQKHPLPFENMPPCIANVEFVKLDGHDAYLLTTVGTICEYTELIFPQDVDRGYIESQGVAQASYKPLTLSQNVVMAPSGYFPTSRGLYSERNVPAGTFLTLALTQQKAESLSFHIKGEDGMSRDVIGDDKMIPLSAINDNQYPNSQFISYTPLEFSNMMNHFSFHDIALRDVVTAVGNHPGYAKYGEFMYNLLDQTGDVHNRMLSFLTVNNFEVCVVQSKEFLKRGEEITVNYNWVAGSTPWRQEDGAMKSPPSYTRLFDKKKRTYIAKEIIKFSDESIEGENWLMTDVKDQVYTIAKADYPFAEYRKGRTLPTEIVNKLPVEPKAAKAKRKQTSKQLQSYLKRSKTYEVIDYDHLTKNGYIILSMLTMDEVNVVKTTASNNTEGLSIAISQSSRELQGDGLRRQIAFTKLPSESQQLLDDIVIKQLKNTLNDIFEFDFDFEIVSPSILCSLAACKRQQLHIDFKKNFLKKGRCYSAIIALDERPVNFVTGDITYTKLLNPGQIFLFSGELVHAGGANMCGDTKYGLHAYVIERHITEQYGCQRALSEALDYTIFK